MRYYPLFLNLTTAKVLIAGAGEVGLRKAADILACTPKALLWVDPDVPCSALPDDLRSNAALVYEQRAASEADCAGHTLIFAATGSRDANGKLAAEAERLGIPCNVIDAPLEGNFIVPSHFEDGNFMLALSTGGSSPAMAKLMRRELQDWYAARYRGLLTLLGRLRPLVLALEQPTERNTELFRALARSRLGEVLGCGNAPGARNILAKLLPPELHGKIEELINGLY